MTLLSGSFAATSFYQGAYFFGLPAVCFFILAYVSISQRDNQFSISEFGMWGAAAAGYLSFVIPAAFVWFTTGAHYHGGGANFGVILIVIAQPIYLPFFMYLGHQIGKEVHMASQKNT